MYVLLMNLIQDRNSNWLIIVIKTNKQNNETNKQNNERNVYSCNRYAKHFVKSQSKIGQITKTKRMSLISLRFVSIVGAAVGEYS